MVTKKMITFFFLLVILAKTFILTHGEVYKVGGSIGWTILGNPDYKAWAASINFQVGDTLLFMYSKEHHNVVRVTHKDYNACNSTVPLASWSTGNDSFTIKRPGHYYFICGFPGHCQYGQKFNIRIMKHNGNEPSPSPGQVGPHTKGPPPFESPQPSTSQSQNQEKSGSLSIGSYSKLWALMAAYGILAIAS